VDIDTIATAMKDVIAGRPTRMTDDEVKATMRDFQGAMRAKMTADREKEAAENKAKGDEFLAKNSKADGVKTLPNGLQYKVLTDGDGPMPKTNDTVTVSYKGSLIDGTVFDHNDHFTTPVTGRTVKGWSEILPLMKTGSKWEVTIPPELGYGPRGFPPKIGPNSVLIFEMNLLSIAPPPTNTPAKPASPAARPGTAGLGSNSIPPSPPATSTPVVSGQIIKVPSAEGLKKGEKIEVITNAPGQ
jgi:FKBP-type peptidyl-prolyl cis-trans isomerase FklB